MSAGNSFGRYIARRRRMMGMTQEVLAESIGVSKSAIAKWETDGGIPDRDNLKKLAEAMKVSVDELHQRIDGLEGGLSASGINITSDIISLLELHGYTVTGPEKDS